MGSLLALSHHEDSGVVAPVSCHARAGGIFLEALPVPKCNPTASPSLWRSSPAGREGDVVSAGGRFVPFRAGQFVSHPQFLLSPVAARGFKPSLDAAQGGASECR